MKYMLLNARLPCDYIGLQSSESRNIGTPSVVHGCVKTAWTDGRSVGTKILEGVVVLANLQHISPPGFALRCSLSKLESEDGTSHRSKISSHSRFSRSPATDLTYWLKRSETIASNRGHHS